MKKFLVISIDVEPDCTPDWTYSDPLTFKGVSIGIKEKLQPVFNKYDITPTYLINNVVLENEESTRVFLNLDGKYELGTHLHPEFIEPQKKHYEYQGKKGEANSCFYDESVEFEKLKNITKLFYNNFGYQPQSFRAGRFSAGDNTIKSIKQLGYKIDTSVTPNVYWNDSTRERPVDFRNASEQPYFVEESIREEAQGRSLLEVPVTIAHRRNSLKGIVKKIIKSPGRQAFYSPLWLRPVFSDNDDFKWLFENFSDKYSDRPIVVYNLMFHNVEVMPGLSPYTKTEKDCSEYLQQLEWIFKYCSRNNIESCSLATLYDHFKAL